MTTRTGSTSIDGTLISDTDLARIAAEDQLHTEQQRSVVRVVASASADVEECRMLLSMLGLTRDTVMAARVTPMSGGNTHAKASGKARAAA